MRFGPNENLHNLREGFLFFLILNSSTSQIQHQYFEVKNQI